MYCQQCGTRNEDGAAVCASCGAALRAMTNAAPPPVVPGERVPNHLAGAILATLFCCLPLGIPAIVFASQVNGKLAVGDVQGARDVSQKAATWMWWSFGLGLLGSLLYFAFCGLFPIFVSAVTSGDF